MKKRLSALLLVMVLLVANVNVYASENEPSEEEASKTEEAESGKVEEDEMDEESRALVESYQNLLGSMVDTYADEDVYAQELAKFPEDYQALLKELHKKHPNWVFKAVNTGLAWDDVVAGESYGTRSLTQKKYSDILLSKASGDYDVSTGAYIPKDGSTWVNVSDPGVAYFVDPRNYLNEEYIFAMEYLGYDQNCHTLSGVESVLSLTKTELANKQISYVNTSGTTVQVTPSMTYGEVFLAAGIKNKISPISLAARMKQETGGSLKYGGLSGTYTYEGKNYTGFYNYYNIGSTADTSKPPLVNGLEYAKKVGWTSPMLAIDGGAQFMASGYIAKGQNTLYFQKFNTVYKPYYSHQYMQNITAPMSEGNTTYNTYKKMGIIDSGFVFYIPVYKNMPSQTSTVTISKNVKTAKVVGGVNLRTGPSTTYKSQILIPAGATVTVEGGVFTDDTAAYGQKLSNPYWLKVTYGNYTGYISSNYFKMDTSLTIDKGSSSTLKLSNVPSGEKIYYETSDPRVATVSNKGVVTGVGAGTCMIYAVTSSGQSLDVIGISVQDNIETPTLNSVTNTKSGIKVSWSKISGVEGYYVYRLVTDGSWKKVATIKGGNTTSYVDTSVQSGTNYTYTVRAYRGSDLGGYNKSGITLTRLSEPNISIESYGEKYVNLKWDKVTGAEGYYLYRRVGTSGSWKLIATIKNRDTVKYTYQGTHTSTTKEYFTVKAYYKTSYGSYTSPGTSARIAITKPKLSAIKNSKSGVRVTWSQVSGAEGYKVYRKVPGGSWKTIATIKSGTTVSYTDGTVKSGTTYIYTVRAYLGQNISGYDSAGIKILYLMEPTLKTSNVTSNSVNLSWSKVSGAKGYYVYRRSGTSGKWTHVATIKKGSTTSYKITGLAKSTKYYFTVKAYSGSTYSSYQDPGVSATTSKASKTSYTTYKATQGVNYRTGAGTSYKKGGSLKKGAKVQVENGYSKKANGYTWYRVKIGSKNYYIASKYLKKA